MGAVKCSISIESMNKLINKHINIACHVKTAATFIPIMSEESGLFIFPALELNSLKLDSSSLWLPQEQQPKS